MGAQKSIHAGGAKIDLSLDLSNKLCAALLLPPQFRVDGGPFSYVEGRFCLQHPNVFGGGEKLDAVWDKGLFESSVLLALRRPRPLYLSQQSFVVQNSVAPEISVLGIPGDGFTRTGSGGINLHRFSAGVDLSEPAHSNWRMTTSIKFEHIRPFSDVGFSMATDSEGFPLTCSGKYHDNMVIFKKESKYATEDDHGFFKLNLQMEQGIPMLSKWLIFNRFKFKLSRAIRMGRSLFLTSVSGGSIVGDMAPYQAFAIGGLGSVRGYGDGAVGSGRSCLVLNGEFIVPLIKGFEGVAFMDYGSDLGSAHHVPGNPALRHGKPGKGLGYGYGLRLSSQKVQLRMDYAMNAFDQRSLYFSVMNVTS